MSNTNTLQVIISRVDRALFEGAASSVIAPGSEGVLTILPEHTAFITPLKNGTIYVETPEETHEIDVENGLLEVSDSQVSVLI